MKIILAVILIISVGIATAYAGNMLLFVGSSGSGTAVTGKILLVDGASFILQTDGTSKICISGGC